ncbi:hypothetical protein [Bordetella genomosp. 1]|uniref:hypothetical protein n=1 Tax=Bordetella genomosp. 1 TaxID=1395607 RepID=UPI001177A2F7|nr:hypothetical protein [Bordetella genomosp. 1]
MSMPVFYSPTTGGFYPDAPYGEVGDEVEISAQLHRALIAGQAAGKIIKADPHGYPALAESESPSADQIETARITAVQRMMDEVARSHKYASLADAISYAEEPAVPRFQVEGRAFRAWRSLVWAYCHPLFARVRSGVEDMPTEESLLASLPMMNLSVE